LPRAVVGLEEDLAIFLLKRRVFNDAWFF